MWMWMLGFVLSLGFLLFVYWLIFARLAPSNRYWTKVGEGKAKFVKMGGAVTRTLIQKRGYRIQEDGEIVEGVDPDSIWSRWFGGQHWIGLYPIAAVHIYTLQWPEMNARGEIENQEEEFDYVSLREHTYHFRVEDAEDLDELPITVTFAVVLRVINPYRAVFVATNWIRKALDVIEAAARNVVTQNTYRGWLEADEDMSSLVHARICAGVDVDGVIITYKGLRDRWGVEVVSQQVVKVDPAPEHRAATLAAWNADRAGEATIVQAKAEAKKIRIEAKAEVSRIKAVYETTQSFGDLGRLMTILEHLSKETGPGIASVHVVPGLAEILGNLTGKRTSEVTKEEIDLLKEKIDELVDLSSSSSGEA